MKFYRSLRNFIISLKTSLGNKSKFASRQWRIEYCSKAFDAFLKEKGIIHQLTVSSNPAQNGVAEMINRTIVESARSMLTHSNMPNVFWGEVVNTAVY